MRRCRGARRAAVADGGSRRTRDRNCNIRLRFGRRLDAGAKARIYHDGTMAGRTSFPPRPRIPVRRFGYHRGHGIRRPLADESADAAAGANDAGGAAGYLGGAVRFRGRSRRAPGGRCVRAGGRARAECGPCRLRRQHGLRPARTHAHRCRAPRRAPACARAVAFRRHRRAAARRRRAACRGAQDLLACARTFRRALGGDRRARPPAQRGHRAMHSGAGIGWRVRRPGPARTPRVAC